VELQQLPERRHRLTHRHCLEYAGEAINIIETELQSDSASLGLIILSVKVLIQSLGGDMGPPIPQGARVVPISTIALEEMILNNGWCKHQWERIGRSLSFDAAHYFSILPRKNPGITHASCTETVCSAWSKGTNVVPSHVDPACHCDMISVPHEDISSTIRNGNIPLISIHTKKDHLYLKCHTWDG
jgi:hypothetical protein